MNVSESSKLPCGRCQNDGLLRDGSNHHDGRQDEPFCTNPRDTSPRLPLAMNKRRQNGGFHAATDRKSIRLRGPLLLRDLQRSPKRFMCGDGYQRIPSDEDIR